MDASQLVTELESFVSAQATIVADPNGNSIIITDTQSNIRHLAQIIRMVDDSAEMETVVRVFTMKFASPTEVASELSQHFPPGASRHPVRRRQSRRCRGGFGGRGGRRAAALCGAGNNNTSDNAF